MSYLNTFNFQMDMFRLFMKIGQRGIRVDIVEKARQSAFAQRQLDHWLPQLQRITMQPEFNPNSPIQVNKFLYEVRGFEKQRRRRIDGTWVLTADENALKILLDQNPGDSFLILMLKWRKLAKLKSTYLDAVIDPDGRIRGSVGWAKTGRCTNGRNPYGTGMNLQTMPRQPLTLEDVVDDKTGMLAVINIKKFLVADPGCFLLEADGMQAEARIVAYWSGDKHYIEMFETGQDIHSFVSTALLGKPITKKDKIERTMGKTVAHGIPYGREPKGINEGIIKALGPEYVLPETKINAFKRWYFQTFPGVKYGYQEKIRKMLENGEPLCNPFGRCRRFLGVVDKKTLKEAWAQIPQSSIPDLINRGIMAWENEGGPITRMCPVLLQVHDSALIQIPETPEIQPEIYRIIKQLFEIPMQVGEYEIVIPIEIQVGKSWADKKEIT